MAQAPQVKDDRSLGELLSQLTHDVVTLVRQELTLAKAEMSQKVAGVGTQLGLLAFGGALAYAGVLSLVAALVLGLIQAGMQPWLAALLSGIIVSAVGGMLVMKGINTIRKQDFTPRQTLETLKEIQHG
jgi:hypothetical protein